MSIHGPFDGLLQVNKKTTRRTPTFDEQKKFKTELTSLINRHSREQFSNTADFLLAELMVSALVAHEQAVLEQERLRGE